MGGLYHKLDLVQCIVMSFGNPIDDIRFPLYHLPILLLNGGGPFPVISRSIPVQSIHLFVVKQVVVWSHMIHFLVLYNVLIGDIMFHKFPLVNMGIPSENQTQRHMVRVLYNKLHSLMVN